MSAPPIAAAGGVLWRPAPGGVEVALVHRPKYDDWSLPKGKLLPGEHVLLGAAREVHEESGHRPCLGRPLGRQHYQKETPAGPAPKHVDWWSMRAAGGSFTPNDEVDAVEWLPPGAARARLTLDRDRDTLAAYVMGPTETVPLVLVRHGGAGDPDRWRGDDRERPLDPLGRAQAAGLAAVLRLYDVARVHSADVVRCMDTVAPYAAGRGIAVAADPLFSEFDHAAHPDAALDRLLELAAGGVPTVVCTQGPVIPDLLRRACAALGVPAPDPPRLDKGAFVVLTLAGGAAVAIERHAPAVEV